MAPSGRQRCMSVLAMSHVKDMHHLDDVTLSQSRGGMSHMMSVDRVAAKPPLPFLLLALFPSSGVAGMVMNIILQLCTSTSAPFNPHFPYLFYTSLPTWFSVFHSVCFLVIVHLILAAKSLSPKNVTIDLPTVFRKPRTVVAVIVARMHGIPNTYT